MIYTGDRGDLLPSLTALTSVYDNYTLTPWPPIRYGETSPAMIGMICKPIHCPIFVGWFDEQLQRLSFHDCFRISYDTKLIYYLACPTKAASLS